MSEPSAETPEKLDRPFSPPAAGASLDEDVRPFPGAYQPPETPYSPARARENTRARLAYSLTFVLAVVVFIIVGAVVGAHYPTADAVNLLGVLVAPLVGLVGAATGFYFAAAVEKNDEKK